MKGKIQRFLSGKINNTYTSSTITLNKVNVLSYKKR